MRALTTRILPALVSMSLVACHAGAQSTATWKTAPGRPITTLYIGDGFYRYIIDPNAEVCALKSGGDDLLPVDCATLARNVPEARAAIGWIEPVAVILPAPAPAAL